MVIDALCGYLVARLATETTISQVQVWQLTVAYGIVAFGIQPFLGVLVDRWKLNRAAGMAGCLITSAGIPAFALSPTLGVVVAGIGNGLFHVAGGGISLQLTPGQAAAPGLFVAPGAIGLALGSMAGSRMILPGWPFAALAVVTGLAGLLAVPRSFNNPAVQSNTSFRLDKAELILLLLCFAIAVRSASGLAMTSLWRPFPAVMLALAIAAVAGKAFAGILADRLGWLRLTIPALLLATPLASFGARHEFFVIPAMLLVQTAMPVTLAAIGRIFPEKPSFAFGLASLVLVIGAIPIFFGAGPTISQPWISAAVQVLCVAALAAALNLMAHGVNDHSAD